jgi:hypothetical protein
MGVNGLMASISHPSDDVVVFHDSGRRVWKRGTFLLK